MTIDKKKIPSTSASDAYDVYDLMHTLLNLPNKPDLSKEHLWTISLDASEMILDIELAGMGSYYIVVKEPAEIFSVPLQKKAHGIILVHNSPSGVLTPSERDIDITDRLNQAGAIVNIKVLDHLIISENSFHSFKDNGLMDKIYSSGKYIPGYEMERILKKEISSMHKRVDSLKAAAERTGMKIGESKGKKEIKLEMAKAMIEEGDSIEKISRITGLSLAQVKELK